MASTGMSGYQESALTLCLMVPMDIGSTHNMVTHGFPTMIGDGHHFIMDVGSLMIFTDGFGCPIRSGDQRGSRGELVVAIMDGRL